VADSANGDKVVSLAEAVGWIEDGSHLTFSGFAHSLAPIAVVHEIIRQQKRNLELSSMGECWAADMLSGAGCLSRTRLSNYMFEGYGRCMNFSRAVQDGKLQVEDYSHFGITSRFMAAAIGLSYLPTKVMAGTDIVNVQTFDDDKHRDVNCPFTGESYTAVRSIEPDIAFIHAHRADREGNTQIFGMTSIIEEQARASKKVVVSVEEIVDRREIARRPELTIIPSFVVDAIVHVPFGAHPAGMYRYYNYDAEHIQQYWDSSRDAATFQDYLDEYVRGTAHYSEYLHKIGLRKLMALRADPYLGY
jgi:acyl CoA:acetate/3-ketoacid CoA transferase alpha subunit